MARIAYDVFRYLGAEHAEKYRAVMLRFVAAKQRFIVHLRPDELRAELPQVPELTDALTQLVAWGNLKADPDTSRVATVEEFNRARYVYQLTQAGEAAERSLGEFDRSFGAAGSLQSAALEDIVEQLRVLVTLAGRRPVDESKVALALTTLSDRFAGLADNAQAFSGDLQRTIDLRGIDSDAFIAYKERLIGYLQRFIQDLMARTAEIAALLESLPEADVDVLLTAAARREARDAAPDAEQVDDVLEPLIEAWRARFAGFRHWFIGGVGSVSQAAELRRMALAAIPQLLQVVQALGERRAGRTDRAADFRELAVWFAEAPSDDDRHRLAAVAFGLGGARHLAVDADTLEQRDRHPVPASTPWAEAPPLEISPRLRRTGSYERRGPGSRVRDRATERLAIQRAVAGAQADAERIAAQLVTDAPVRLGDVPVVDAEGRAALLHLVADALGTRRRPEEAVSIDSLDGAFTVAVVPPDSEARDALVLDDGVLTGPAHLVHIRQGRAS